MSYDKEYPMPEQNACGGYYCSEEHGHIDCQKVMNPLQDTDKMPFGAHKGKLMQDVPASYFHYLWRNGMKDDKQSNVADYIRRNLSALQAEYKDGIWT